MTATMRTSQVSLTPERHEGFNFDLPEGGSVSVFNPTDDLPADLRVEGRDDLLLAHAVIIEPGQDAKTSLIRFGRNLIAHKKFEADLVERHASRGWVVAGSIAVSIAAGTGIMLQRRSRS